MVNFLILEGVQENHGPRQSGNRLLACEVKSGATLHTAFLKNLHQFADRTETLLPKPELELRLVYGGDRTQRRSETDCLGWREIHEIK